MKPLHIPHKPPGANNKDCNNSSSKYKASRDCSSSGYCNNCSCSVDYRNSNHQDHSTLPCYELSYAGNDHHNNLHRPGICDHHFLLLLHIRRADARENNKHHLEFGRFCKLRCSPLKQQPIKQGVELNVSWQQV